MSLASPLYDIMGSGHVLKSALSFIRRWHADKNFNPNSEIERAELAVAEYHTRLVSAAKHLVTEEEKWKLEIEARDAAIHTLAEWHDDDTMESEFNSLVEGFKNDYITKALVKKLDEALTA